MPQDQTNNSEVARWYVIHTYSGYENKVKDTLEKAVENREMQHLVQEVIVPMEEQIEIKDDKRKTTLRKVFPGYVLIHMIMNDDTWYVVRNTRGVTGFVGPGSKPVPLTDEEMNNLGIKKTNIACDYKLGDMVMAVTGVWENTVGNIKSINEGKQTVTIMVEMFGRETPVELGFAEIRRM